MSVDELLDVAYPLRVPDHIQATRLHITDQPGKVGTVVGAFLTKSPAHTGVRIGGGCANMSGEDKREMIDYFIRGFAEFRGFVSSGATRAVTDECLLDPMVTDIPAALVRAYGNRILTLSTAPRTGQMALVDDSRFVLDTANGTLPNPGVHMIIVFQPLFAHEVMGWDGDVVPYFELFNHYVREAGWKFGLVVWNGGNVTATEIVTAARLGWPVIVVQGSGRMADVFADWRLNGNTVEGYGLTDTQLKCITVVQRNDPGSLARALREYGLIAA